MVLIKPLLRICYEATCIFVNLCFCKAKSTEPETLLSKIDQEQINMRNRMLTDNGHLIIQMARCCIENPQDLERAFPNVNKDIGPILRNLDRDVITLIADTPIVVNT